MQKIGIGITSYKRPEHLGLCLRQILKHTTDVDSVEIENGIIEQRKRNKSHYILDSDNKKIYVAKDMPNIAKAKNECLYNLRDCDYIFLFDDDCFPVKDGWVDYFINSDVHHSLYLTSRHNYCGSMFGKEYVYGYVDCGGCFMYINKLAFERIGYFNSEYKQYGFEHAGWSKRFYPYSYISLNECDQYLYSLDYQGEGNWGVKHRQSITDYKAMQESIDYNRMVFEKEINSDKIYYDYKP